MNIQVGTFIPFYNTKKKYITFKKNVYVCVCGVSLAGMVPWVFVLVAISQGCPVREIRYDFKYLVGTYPILGHVC